MDFANLQASMQKVTDDFVRDLSSMRTGRASVGMVENLEVSVYGGQQRLRVMEVGTITSPDHQTIVIDPWDKSIIGDINKGILMANVGLNPAIDGEIIRISIPPMTTEDKEKMVKLVSTKLEGAKVAVRQARQDGMQEIKKGFEGKEITEDEKFASEKKLQELTDQYITKLETLAKNKEAEMMQV